MKVFNWDGSLAVELPRALVDELGLKDGDELHVVAARSGTIEVETPEQLRRRWIENLASLQLPLPADYKFDRDEANER